MKDWRGNESIGGGDSGDDTSETEQAELGEQGEIAEQNEVETTDEEAGGESDFANGMRGAIAGEIAINGAESDALAKDKRLTQDTLTHENLEQEEESTQDTLTQDQSKRNEQTTQNERLHARRTMSETVREVRERTRDGEVGLTELRPMQEKICDRDHLVDQRIFVTDAEDLGRTDFRLKLAEKEFKRLIDELKEKGRTASGAEVSMGRLVYESSKSQSSNPYRILEDFDVCRAYVFERENEAGQKMKVFVAEPREKEGAGFSDFLHIVRGAIGLVKIEAPREMSPEATEELLGKIMTEDLGVPDALEDVTAEAERDYKIVEYAKRVRKSPNQLTDKERQRALAMTREEIYPGCTALKDEGRHFEIWRRFGKMNLIHQMYRGGVDSIMGLLDRGLAGSGNRFPRGATESGLSSEADFFSGGADFLFLRAMTDDAMKELSPRTTVVYKDEILDFMPTWYKKDQFGSTDPDSQKKLMSTEEFFECLEQIDELGGRYPMDNEGMLPIGIGPQFIDRVLVESEWKREEVIEALKREGYDEFNGRPIEDVIGVLPSGGMPEEEELADYGEDKEADLMLMQAEKELAEMMANGVFPNDGNFFNDEYDEGSSMMGAADDPWMMGGNAGATFDVDAGGEPDFDGEDWEGYLSEDSLY